MLLDCTWRAWGVLGKPESVEACSWISLPTLTCLGLLVEKTQKDIFKGFFFCFNRSQPGRNVATDAWTVFLNG